MFTGLVESLGTVVEINQCSPGVRFVVSCVGLETSDASSSEIASLGDSVSINGCCLTVVELSKDRVAFDAGEETLKRTTLAELSVGDGVNWERSLKVGDRMGGHFVTGHIDCVGEVVRRDDDGEWCHFWVRLPEKWISHVVEKGSVAVDGVSLTVVDVTADSFSVALIPHTLDVTTIGRRSVGDKVNIETDVLAKYIEKAVAAGNCTQT